MAIRNEFRIPPAGLALLAFLSLFPLCANCQTATAVEACDSLRITGPSMKMWEDQLLSARAMEKQLDQQQTSLLKTQDLAETLAYMKSYLVNYLNTATAGEATATAGSGALTNEQQFASNTDISRSLEDMNALQAKVAARISSLKKSIDELTARSNAATRAANATGDKYFEASKAFDECWERAHPAAAKPSTTPANNLPAFVTNTPPAAKQPVPAKAPPSLAGTWSFDTDGGCQYQNGFVPGVNHEPDGPMQLEDNGNGNFSGKIAGEQIKSTVDGTLNGGDVALNVHPHSYFDDPVLNPPKDPYTGGWSSVLVLKGELSVKGNIVQGQVFLNSSKPNCTFTMTHGN